MKIRLSELKRIIREEVEALTEAAPAGGITLQSKGHPNNINILTDTESRLWRVDPKNRKSLGLTAADIRAQMGGKDSMPLEDFSDDVQDAVHAVWDMLEPMPRPRAEYPRAEYDPSLEFRRDYGTGRHMVTDPEGNPIPGAYARPSQWREPRRMWGKGT